MLGHPGAADGRTDAMQAQTAPGVLERDAQLPATAHVHTVSGLPYDLRREEGQSTAGYDELDANTALVIRLPEYQHHTNHLRVSVRETRHLYRETHTGDRHLKTVYFP